MTNTPVTAWKIDAPCGICFDEFRDGDLVVILGCPGNHVLCVSCHDKLQKADQEQQEELQGIAEGDLYDTELIEIDRRREGADKCPVCRAKSPAALLVVGQRFYTGRQDDPVDLTNGE